MFCRVSVLRLKAAVSREFILFVFAAFIAEVFSGASRGLAEPVLRRSSASGGGDMQFRVLAWAWVLSAPAPFTETRTARKPQTLNP